MRFASIFLCGALLANASSYFEPNRGQARIASAFLARTSNGTIATGPDAIGYVRRDGSSSAIVFEGASARAVARPGDPLPGVSHYVRGRDPASWIWDVPRFSAVRYRGVYPGIDLLYRAANSDVDFDFLVSPGADPSRILMRVPAGARIDASGALAFGGVSAHAPVAWQTISAKRVHVSARFVMHRRRASIQLGDYDPALPLTIDPLIQFATFLGGSGNDIGLRVISGTDGAIFTAGNTMSADFPASLAPGNPLNRPETLFEPTAYVTRLKPDASAMDWSLFIGGSGRQSVFALKQDVFGNVYLLGGTTSANFPVTTGAWHGTIDPSLTDIFLVKLDGKTGRVIASTFLGIALSPNRLDAGAMLAIDPAGGVYAGGYKLYGGALATTPGAFQAAGPAAEFAIRLNSAMNAAAYVTSWPLGSIAGMDVDSAGNLLIGGMANGTVQSLAPPFPAVNPLPGIDQAPESPNQAYIAKLNPAGTAVTFATLLHGNGNGSAITDLKLATDSSIYLAGWSSGASFPQVNPIAIDPLPAGYPSPDNIYPAPFLARLAADGRSIVQSTFFYSPAYVPPPGQTLNENLRLALLPNGSTCMAGLNMTVAQQTPGGLAAPNSMGFNPIGWSVTCTDPAGASIYLKTGLPTTGGSGYTDLAVTPDGALLLTGSAYGTFATTPGVVQPNFGGAGPYRDYSNLGLIDPGDAFLMRVNLANPAPAIQNTVPDSLVLGDGTTGNCSLNLFGSGFAYGASATVAGQAATLTFIDSGHATVSDICGALQPGDNHIAMTLPPPGGGTSDKILTVLNAPPSGISVSPASVTQGASETKLVIRAANLSAASALYSNGSPRAATFVPDSSTARSGRFELLLEPPDMAQPAIAQITGSNPAPGGGLSVPAPFTVEPASGVGVPVLNTPTPLTFGGTPSLGPQISLTGSGFTANTRIFWDGASVPVSSFTATRIAIQPPAADLTKWGAHDVYAMDGVFQSPTVREFIGRSVDVRSSAYDPAQNVLYVLSRSTLYADASDLLILDGATGSLLNSLPA
ncbi:MAG: hypothetical protein ABI165_18870, partial [Bryobacteraceae bacterium]